MKALPPAQQVMRLNEQILAEHAIRLDHSAKILDFCCGSGRHVYEHRDHGYQDVHGYDISNQTVLRDTQDAAFFHFDPKGEISHLPFPDNTFDFVHSTSVFEHV